MKENVKLKSPKQLADFLEKNNPLKAKGTLVASPTGKRCCAMGWLGIISGVPPERMMGYGLLCSVVSYEGWLDQRVSLYSSRNETKIANLSDGTSGWGDVIEFLRKLRPDGTLKKGASL